MANTNVTMRIDETLKSQLQELMSSLGLDMTTFFTMAAKQAVREQALPFKPGYMDCKHINWQCRIQTITKKGKLLYHLMTNGKMKPNGMICLNR